MVVCIAAFSLVGIMFSYHGKGDLALSPTPELINPTPQPSATPVQTPRPAVSTKPKAGIIAKEVGSYQQLTEEMYKQGTWLKLAADCNSIVPSNVVYYNDTQIMLDNTASTEKHILKIGGREYLLEAGEWYLTTLSSPTLPATLSLYCGAMELGSIDLIARPK
jgi:hypothetical protein